MINALPEELCDFLKAGGQLSYDPSRCECGEVKLKHLDELRYGKVWLDASDAGRQAHIEIPAISLLKSCEAYDPEYLLLWLPNERLFGSWDRDHWKLHVFPGTCWGQLLLAPVKFLNAQWHDYDEEYSIEWHPHEGYDPKPGYPDELSAL